LADEVTDLRESELALAEELMAIHRESYGKGADRARVHILDDMVVALLDEIELLPNEAFMVDAGRTDAVLQIRHQYQQAIETTFRAAVERATGRRVVSFASNTQLDPNYSVEFFRLGPAHVTDLDESMPDG
jgi:uncharacterized protein YbcI